LEQLYAKNLQPVRSKKPTTSGLHGGVMKMGRVVWAEGLKYIHTYVDKSTDG